MLRRLAAALPLCAVCGVTACTLLVDTGGLSNAGAGGAPNDGAVPMLPVSEAGADGAASDAAAGDAPSSSSPCATVHAFCDDFDTGTTDLAARWDVLHTTAGPMLLDTTQPKSPPRSLRMHLTPTTGNKDSRLGKNVAVISGTARVELDIFIPTPAGPWTEVDPIGVQLTPTPTGYDFHGLYLVTRSDSTFLQYFASKKAGNLDNRAPLSTISKDVWHHVVITFSYATTPPKGTISVDGDVGSVDMVTPVATKLELQLGASYTQDTNLDWSLYFDNATIDTP